MLFCLEFPICDQKIQYFAGYDRYEVALSYFKLKIPNIPNFVLFGCEIDDYGQTTYSHQYSLLWQYVRTLLTYMAKC